VIDKCRDAFICSYLGNIFINIDMTAPMATNVVPNYAFHDDKQERGGGEVSDAEIPTGSGLC
jgi:hypothetical protein